MIRALIDAANSVSPKVWNVLQFHALLGVVAFGGSLILHSHADAGLPLVTGAFALLRFETGDRAQ